LSKSCNSCGGDITWKSPYTKGDRTLNLDNSVHSCKKPDTPDQASEPKSPNSILAECIEFEQTFKDLTDAKFDSLVRLYNTRVMQK